MKNCTCGVKFTGGLHSNWCDTLAPDEPEPPTLQSPFDPGGVSFTTSWLKTLYPAGQAIPWVKPSTTGLQPPAKPAPKATRFGDGTNALDKICACGEYIVRVGVSYVADDLSLHGARACAPSSGGVIVSTTPQP